MQARSPVITLAAILSECAPERQQDVETSESMSANAGAGEDGAQSVRDLTARMRAGEEAAFTEFYDRYYDRLFRYLLLLTRGNEAITRELLQATMTKAMQKIRAFSIEPQLWNWLAAIARNAFIDSIRRTRRAPKIVSLLSGEGIEEPTAPPEKADDELLTVLEGCLGEMGAEERALIESFYFDDGSHRSVAERYGTTAKAVESRL